MSVEAAVAEPVAAAATPVPTVPAAPPVPATPVPGGAVPGHGPITPDTPVEFTGPDGQPITKTFRELTEAVTRPSLTPDQVAEYQKYKKAWEGDPATIAELAQSMVPKAPAPAPGSPDEKFLTLTQEIAQLKEVLKDQTQFKQNLTQQAELHQIKTALQHPDLQKSFPVLGKVPNAAEEIRNRVDVYRSQLPNGKDPGMQKQIYAQALQDVNNYWTEAAKAFGYQPSAISQTPTTPNISVVNDRGVDNKMEPARWVYDPKTGGIVDRSRMAQGVPPSEPILPPTNGGAVPPVPSGPPTNTRMSVQDMVAGMKARRTAMSGGQ